jgi:hypothetical protein
MNTFSRSWNLFKSTWSVLMADKELTLFPLLAALVTLIVTVVLLGGGMAVVATNPALNQAVMDAASSMDSGEGSPAQTIAFFAVLFVYYLIMSIIATYFMTGLAGAALKRFEGGDPTFRDGLRIANSRFGSIFGFSVINATVGVVLSALRSRDNTGGRIAASLGGAAWNIVTFLVVPVIAAKGISPIDAIKESGSLLRRTWGEQIVGSAGIGLVLGILMVIAAVLGGFLAIAVSGSTAALITVIVLTVLVVATLGVVNSSLNGIYRAAVYHYADVGEVAAQYQPELIESAFRPQKA